MRCVALTVMLIGFGFGAYAEDAKVPVPEAAKIKDAEATIKDVFKEEYGKRGVEDKRALGMKLLQQGLETKDDPASRYVLLKEAAANAVAGGDAETAAKALDALGQQFEVDAVALKAEAFAKIVPATADAAKALTRVYLKAIEDAVAADNYDGAVKLCAAAEGASRKTQDMPLASQVSARVKEVRALQADFAKVKAAQATLKEKPDDPDANLAVGKFLCFMKGDWEKGLPLLAKGSDAKLKELAAKEQAGATQANEFVALGDAWQSAGEKERNTTVKLKLIERERYWYTFALPKLEGLARVKVQKRLDVISGQSKMTYLIDLPEIDPSVGWGKFGKGNRGYDAQPIMVEGKAQPRGLAMYPPANGNAHVQYALGKNFDVFRSTIALADPGIGCVTPLVFRVVGDGKVLWESKPTKEVKKPQECVVPVVGVIVLTLEVVCTGPNTDATAVWANPHLEK